MRRAEGLKRGGQVGGQEVDPRSGWLLYMSPKAVLDKAKNTAVESGSSNLRREGGGGNELFRISMLKLPPFAQS